MPTKAVSWTQQPVVLGDLRHLHFDRGASGAFTATASYEVRDELGTVRFVKTLTQAVGSWPANLTVILNAINSAEGT